MSVSGGEGIQNFHLEPVENSGTMMMVLVAYSIEKMKESGITFYMHGTTKREQ